MLECNNLVKLYKGKEVVSDLSFKVHKKEVFGLLGSNGAGKTTTIKMILGLIKQDRGTIHKTEKIKVGYSPETPYFHPFLSGYEVLEFLGKLQKIDKGLLYLEIERILRMVGLYDDRDNKVKYYSKGMIQRLAVGQSLLGDPDLIILDEPTSGLDAIGRIKMLDFIGELRNRDKTIIINSHIIKDIERTADRGIIMDKGKLLREWDLKGEDQDTNLEKLFIETIGGVDYIDNNA